MFEKFMPLQYTICSTAGVVWFKFTRDMQCIEKTYRINSMDFGRFALPCSCNAPDSKPTNHPAIVSRSAYKSSTENFICGVRPKTTNHQFDILSWVVYFNSFYH